MTPLRIQVKALRVDRGLSQLELADAANVRQSLISEIENGQTKRISLDALDRIAKVLGVEPGSLLEREPKRKG